jgi:RNA polymerase sigma-70 factor (ECF subfamily)
MTTTQFTETFEQARSQLRSYILRITASVQDAEDIVQDTYIKASEKLESFRGESSIKTWIFSIASNLAKDNLRAKKRWPENVSDICKDHALSDPDYFPQALQLHATSPHGQFEVKEHITFCLTCISKSLPLEQQICLLLKEVYAFKVEEIATIIDSTEAMVKYYLHTGRSKMIKIFDGRCALVSKEGVCHQCSELNGIFNPQQNTQEELMKIEMARVAEKGEKEHLFDLRMQIMKEIDPFITGGYELQQHHLEYNRKVMDKYLEKNQD